MGVRWVQENVPADFVVVLNNDVEILQKDSAPKVEAIYRRHSFDVLGRVLSQCFRYSPESEEPSRIFTGIRKKETGKVARTKNPILLLLSSGERTARQSGREYSAEEEQNSVSTAVSLRREVYCMVPA